MLQAVQQMGKRFQACGNLLELWQKLAEVFELVRCLAQPSHLAGCLSQLHRGGDGDGSRDAGDAEQDENQDRDGPTPTHASRHRSALVDGAAAGREQIVARIRFPRHGGRLGSSVDGGSNWSGVVQSEQTSVAGGTISPGG